MNMISTANAFSAYEETLHLHGPNLKLTNAFTDDRTEEHYRAVQAAARRLLESEPFSDRAALHYTHWTTELAHLCRARGNTAETKDLYREALVQLAPLRNEQPSCWRDYACGFYSKLAVLYAAEDRHTQAETMYRRAIAVSEEDPAEHDRTLWHTRMLAFFLLRRGRIAEAEELYTQTLGTARALSETHSLRSYLNVFCEACQEAAFFYRMTNRPGESEKLLLELLTESRRLAAHNPTRYGTAPAAVCTELRFFHLKYGHAAEAEEYRREAADVWQREDPGDAEKSRTSLLCDCSRLRSCLAAVHERKFEPGPRLANLCFSVWTDSQAAELPDTGDLLRSAHRIARHHRCLPLCARIAETAVTAEGAPAK